MARIGLIVACITVLALLAVTAFLKVSLDEATTELSDLRTKHQDAQDALKGERIQTAAAIAEQERRIGDLEKSERELTRIQTQLEGLERDLAEKDKTLQENRTRIADLKGQVDRVNRELDTAQEQLKARRKIHDELIPKLDEAKQTNEKLIGQLKEIRGEKARLENELAQALAKNEEIAKENEYLRSLAPDLAGNEIVGKVEESVPPRKIIISELSSAPKKGLEFSVFRGPEFIARAQVYRVFEKYAGARITFIQQGKDVRPGDTVKTGF